MKKERTHSFKDFWFALKLIMKISPMDIIVGIISNTAYWFFSAYIQGVLFLKKVLEMITSSNATFEDFIILILLFCGGGLLARAISLGGSYFMEISSDKVRKKLNEKILTKASQIDIECYENPEFYNDYKRATEVVTHNCFYSFRYHIANMISSIITGVFLVIYVMKIDPKLFFVYIVLVAALIFDAIKAKLEYKKNKDMTANRREKAYAQRVVFLRDYSKDMRTSGIFNIITKRFSEAVESNREIIKKHGKKLALIKALSIFVSEVVPMLTAYVYGAYRFAVRQDLDISDFSVLMTSIDKIGTIVSGVATDISELQKLTLDFEHLRNFFDYENSVLSGDRIADEIKSIEFKNVTFTYPGAENPSIKNISLKMNGNDTIAVVGKNGAGKSTFVKLLLRFYDPNEGEILVNGINIKEYDLSSLREKMGTVFQSYKVFALSVNENVLCRECETDEDKALSEQSLIASGAYDKISTLPQGAETQLTREFDKKGIGLSGGEQQKVATARMFAHSFDMAILDEPSSALDPIAEYKMYESLIEATKDKMVIYISHRLSSAVLSDKIFVFDGGEIIENGTHSELMGQNGLYAEMFTMQASNYKENGEEATK